MQARATSTRIHGGRGADRSSKARGSEATPEAQCVPLMLSRESVDLGHSWMHPHRGWYYDGLQSAISPESSCQYLIQRGTFRHAGKLLFQLLRKQSMRPVQARADRANRAAYLSGRIRV